MYNICMSYEQADVSTNFMISCPYPIDYRFLHVRPDFQVSSFTVWEPGATKYVSMLICLLVVMNSNSILNSFHYFIVSIYIQ